MERRSIVNRKDGIEELELYEVGEIAIANRERRDTYDYLLIGQSLSTDIVYLTLAV